MAEKKSWPAWRYGPNGQADIFQSPEEVPDGWQNHPDKVAGGAGENPLAAFDVSREEAIEILRGDGYNVRKNTSDKKLAKMLKENYASDDGK